MGRLRNQLRWVAMILGFASALGMAGPNDVDVARVRALIEMLASKNVGPKLNGEEYVGDDQGVAFGREYDRELQVPVYLAIQQLLGEGDPAMDLLLEHTRDARYSLSVEAILDQNRTVSQVCRAIATAKVFCYEPEIHVITQDQIGLYPKRDRSLAEESFEAWWKRKRKRGLAAVQIEAIDSQITFFNKVDGRRASPPRPDAERLPIQEFNRLKNENLGILRAIRRCIVETRTPYRPKSMQGEYASLLGLPWTTSRLER